MNSIDSRLQRLFRAAAAASAAAELPTEAPFWMESQVLAGFRAEINRDPAAEFVPIYKGAFVCACAIILISAALTFSFHETPPGEWVIMDSTIQATFLQ